MSISPTGSALRRALDGPFHEVKQRWRTEVKGLFNLEVGVSATRQSAG